MKEKSRIAARLFIVTTLISTLLISSTAFAVPPAATQKPATVQAAPSAASRMLDRNAPPSGTITITSPASGETWYVGSRKDIQWNCTGSCSLVDVTLWLGGVKTFVVGTAIGSGRTSYTIPTTAAAGSYELRVTSDYDTGVEARQPVTAALPSITVTAPKANEQLYWGSQYTITWSYAGDPGSVKLYINSNPLPGSLSPITMVAGQGSATWTLPTSPPTYSSGQQLTGPFSITVVSTARSAISGSSAQFLISCRKSLCGAVCADLQTDAGNCGWCGHICDGATCNSGKCVCPSQYPNLCHFYQAATPPPDKWECDDTSGGKGKKPGGCQQPPGSPAVAYDYCVNLQNSTTPQLYVLKDCGSCGNFCPTNMTCVNASCVCQSPKVMCGNSCIDVTRDLNNCGSCGKQCPGQNYCQNGVCYAY